jgi:hypothetical protein
MDVQAQESVSREPIRKHATIFESIDSRSFVLIRG